MLVTIKSLRTLLLISLLTAFNLPVAAETEDPATASEAAETAAEIEDVFQVEFLIVRPTNRDDMQFEDWEGDRPALASDEQTQSEFAVAQPLEETPFFGWVDEASSDLPNTLKRVNESSAYEVLMHRAWRQQATPRDNATAYFVQLPFDDRNEPQLIITPDESSIPSAVLEVATEGFQTVDEVAEEALQPSEAKAGVWGTFSFSKARYLHFTLDLLMSESEVTEENPWQSNWQAPAENNGLGDGFGLSGPEEASALSESLGLATIPEKKQYHYHLAESRRVKTEQTHYFDHPAFAVLAHVRRLTPEEQAEYVASLAQPVPTQEVPALAP